MSPLRPVVLYAVLGLLWPAPGSAQAPADRCPDVYVVERGDTLGDIARRFYGDVRAYTRLHRENVDAIGPDPWVLEVGTELRLACGAGAGTVAAAESVERPAVAVDGWSPFVDADRLAALGAGLGAVQVVDIRDERPEDSGLVPGAVSSPFEGWARETPTGRQPPAPDELAAQLGRAGLELDRPVVIVDSDGGGESLGRAAWVYWLLKSAGARQLAILDGGHAGWVDGRRRLWASPARPRPSRTGVALADTWRATRDELERIAEGELAGGLIEARPDDRAGSPILPGASGLVLPGTSGFTAGGGPAPLAELRLSALAALKDLPLPWERAPVVSYGRSVTDAALAWFMASEIAGIRNVLLYPAEVDTWRNAGTGLPVPRL